MKPRLLTMFGVAMAMFGGVLGCASANSDRAAAGGAAGDLGANVGGASFGGTGAGGTSVAGMSDFGGAPSGGASATGDACEEHPTLLRSQGTELSLQLSPTLDGKPMAFGQTNAVSDGGSVVPLNFRFYISEVQLLPKSGDPVAVDLVTENGEAENYGMHLFNADDDDASTVRVLAPAGEYVGLSFALGIKLACNQQSPRDLADPLTDVSQMTWPHTGGFLYLRYEGRYTAAEGSAATPADIPSAVHMGGSITKEMVPRATVSGALSIDANGRATANLYVAVDEMFKGATSNVDVSDVAVGLLSTPEAIAGERLRRGLPELQLFTLGEFQAIQ